MTYLRDRKNAFVYAVSGLLQSFKKEAHMQIHAVSATLVVIFGYCFEISAGEWIAVSFCIALVLIAEITNTAVEKICDMISLEIRPTIKYVKDISAAAVLIACLLAVITGVIIFLPYVSALLDE